MNFIIAQLSISFDTCQPGYGSVVILMLVITVLSTNTFFRSCICVEYFSENVTFIVKQEKNIRVVTSSLSFNNLACIYLFIYFNFGNVIKAMATRFDVQ